MGQITCISWDKKKAKGGEFISPVLNISEEHIPICVQFYINTVTPENSVHASNQLFIHVHVH